jgi:hypothetical protein
LATPNYGFEKRQKELAKKKKKEEKLKQRAADKAAGIVSPDDANEVDTEAEGDEAPAPESGSTPQP